MKNINSDFTCCKLSAFNFVFRYFLSNFYVYTNKHISLSLKYINVCINIQRCLYYIYIPIIYVRQVVCLYKYYIYYIIVCVCVCVFQHCGVILKLSLPTPRIQKCVLFSDLIMTLKLLIHLNIHFFTLHRDTLLYPHI